MTEDDNIRIEELFRAAAQQEIADHGFTDRVMASLPVEECAVRATAPQMAGADAAAARRQRLMANLWTAACVAAGIVMVIAGRAWELPATYLYVLMRTLPTFDIVSLSHLLLLSATVITAAIWLFHRLDSMPVALRKKDMKHGFFII